MQVRLKRLHRWQTNRRVASKQVSTSPSRVIHHFNHIDKSRIVLRIDRNNEWQTRRVKDALINYVLNAQCLDYNKGIYTRIYMRLHYSSSARILCFIVPLSGYCFTDCKRASGVRLTQHPRIFTFEILSMQCYQN